MNISLVFVLLTLAFVNGNPVNDGEDAAYFVSGVTGLESATQDEAKENYPVSSYSNYGNAPVIPVSPGQKILRENPLHYRVINSKGGSQLQDHENQQKEEEQEQEKEKEEHPVKGSKNPRPIIKRPAVVKKQPGSIHNTETENLESPFPKVISGKRRLSDEDAHIDHVGRVEQNGQTKGNNYAIYQNPAVSNPIYLSITPGQTYKKVVKQVYTLPETGYYNYPATTLPQNGQYIYKSQVNYARKPIIQWVDPVYTNTGGLQYSSNLDINKDKVSTDVEVVQPNSEKSDDSAKISVGSYASDERVKVERVKHRPVVLPININTHLTVPYGTQPYGYSHGLGGASYLVAQPQVSYNPYWPHVAPNGGYNREHLTPKVVYLTPNYRAPSPVEWSTYYPGFQGSSYAPQAYPVQYGGLQYSVDNQDTVVNNVKQTDSVHIQSEINGPVVNSNEKDSSQAYPIYYYKK